MDSRVEETTLHLLYKDFTEDEHALATAHLNALPKR